MITHIIGDASPYISPNIKNDGNLHARLISNEMSRENRSDFQTSTDRSNRWRYYMHCAYTIHITRILRFSKHQRAPTSFGTRDAVK